MDEQLLLSSRNVLAIVPFFRRRDSIVWQMRQAFALAQILPRILINESLLVVETQ
jgi:hypothetical protein